MFHSRSFPLFLKPIKIDPVTLESQLFRQACAVANEDLRIEPHVGSELKLKLKIYTKES